MTKQRPNNETIQNKLRNKKKKKITIGPPKKKKLKWSENWRKKKVEEKNELEMSKKIDQWINK